MADNQRSDLIRSPFPNIENLDRYADESGDEMVANLDASDYDSAKRAIAEEGRTDTISKIESAFRHGVYAGAFMHSSALYPTIHRMDLTMRTAFAQVNDLLLVVSDDARPEVNAIRKTLADLYNEMYREHNEDTNNLIRAKTGLVPLGLDAVEDSSREDRIRAGRMIAMQHPVSFLGYVLQEMTNDRSGCRCLHCLAAWQIQKSRGVEQNQIPALMKQATEMMAADSPDADAQYLGFFNGLYAEALKVRNGEMYELIAEVDTGAVNSAASSILSNVMRKKD